jgi:mono/diheme cytochrome c family protein
MRSGGSINAFRRPDTMTIKHTIGILAASTAALCTLAAAAMAQDTARAGLNSAGPVRGDAEAAAIAANGQRFPQTSGEDLYMNVCAACHMPDGKGAEGAGFYPTLAANRKLAAKAYPAYVVTKGLNGMPAVGEMMSDEQVAEVVNYVRTHFGNSYSDALQPNEVQALR